MGSDDDDDEYNEVYYHRGSNEGMDSSSQLNLIVPPHLASSSNFISSSNLVFPPSLISPPSLENISMDHGQMDSYLDRRGNVPYNADRRESIPSELVVGMETTPPIHRKKSHRLKGDTLGSSIDESRKLEEIDILVTFLKGQYFLYSTSEYLTQQKINYLTIPSFLFSIVVTILAPLISEYHWSGILISALTAFITSALGCVRFYNLDASATTYLELSNQYNRMQTSLEMVSNSFILNLGMDNYQKHTYIFNRLRDTELRIQELKENGHCLPPEEVKRIIPIIYHVNIFSFIKKIERLKIQLIENYDKIKKEEQYIFKKWNSHKNHPHESIAETATIQTTKGWKKKHGEYSREKNRLEHLHKQKVAIRKEYTYCVNAYSHIDDIFTREMANASSINGNWIWWMIRSYFYSIHNSYLPGVNPVVDRHLQFIFLNDSDHAKKKDSNSGPGLSAAHSPEISLEHEYEMA
jgi:hypothetical protein